MKNFMLVLAFGFALAGATQALAEPPVAGVVPLGVTVAELKAVTLGMSAKKHILDKGVYNDAKETIGEIEDIVITPNHMVSFAIVGVGGFLGLGEHLVAIPMTQLKFRSAEGTFLLPGATKDALKKLPPFVYAPG